jgi:hypothetical protein
MSEVELLDFRVKQAKESGTQVKKGKQHTRDSPEVGESESLGPAPLLLATLAGLGMLTLDNGGSSAANTAANSPATLPQPPLPEHTAPAPPSGHKTRHPVKPLAGKSIPSPL